MDSTTSAANESFIFDFEETYNNRNYAIVSICVHALLIISVVLGNGLVITVYCSNKAIRRILFNRYILCLASADFLVGISAIPQFTFQVFLRHGLHLSDSATVAVEWAGRFPIMLSVFVIISMTYDRVQLVADPIKYQTSKSGTKTTRVLIGVCIFSALYANIYATVRLFSLHVILPPVPIAAFSPEDLFKFILLVEFTPVFFNFLLPLSLILIMNGIFLYKLKKSFMGFDHHHGDGGNRSTKSNARNDQRNISTDSDNVSMASFTMEDQGNDRDESGRQKEDKRHSKMGMRERQLREVARNLLILVMVYLVCWVPINTMGLLFLVGVHIPFPIVHVSFLVMYLNSAINPLLYAATSRGYKLGLQRVLCRRGSEYQERSDSTKTVDTRASSFSTRM